MFERSEFGRVGRRRLLLASKLQRKNEFCLLFFVTQKVREIELILQYQLLLADTEGLKYY